MSLFVSFNPAESREECYEEVLPQIEAIIAEESNLIANLANVSSVLKEVFGFFWVGFYLVDGEELVLAPFQGPVACTRIKFGKGVCGSAWRDKEVKLVSNVEEFPGHIPCSSRSKSEIVLPIYQNGNVVAVLDIDSDHLNDFDETDKRYLTQLCLLLEKRWNLKSY